VHKLWSSICNATKGIALEFGLVLTIALPTSGDSLWHNGHSQSLAADRKAHAVGDILTIVLQENTTATKDNTTTTSKSSDVNASLSAFLYPPAATGLLSHNGALPTLQFNSEHEFDGGGTIDNEETITTRIPVRVVDVLPNRILLVEGSRNTAFGGEEQDVILRGIVRPEDIAANNTVFSYNVAEASIRFVTKGPISETQRKGWLTKLWEKLTPF